MLSYKRAQTLLCYLLKSVSDCSCNLSTVQSSQFYLQSWIVRVWRSISNNRWFSLEHTFYTVVCLRRAPTTSEDFCNAGSRLHWYGRRQNSEVRWLLGCAQGYQLSGRPLAELCEHNAAVARQLGRISVSSKVN